MVRRGCAAALLFVSACGGSTIRPDPVTGLTISCPPNRSVESAAGGAVPLAYDAPQTSGGAAPVTATCTPPSGSQFSVGSTSVTCQARDAGPQTASCTFSVVVQAAPRLTAVRILAFGDSITAGVVSNPLGLMIVSPPESYPYGLQQRLVARYQQQMPVILNEGNAAELASVEGIQRFRSVLLSSRPEAVLLMEGVNDLGFAQMGANAAISALRSMVIEAKLQNVKVVLATISPVRAGGARRRDGVAVMIPGFNDRVRELAAAQAVPLADIYGAMKDDLASMIGVDDLHPTVHGYDVMAGVFFDAIKLNFEALHGIQGLRP